MTGQFAPLLRRQRLLIGLTQADLATAAQVSVRTVRNLERGSVRPQHRTAELLADALDLTGPDRSRLLAAGARDGDRLVTGSPAPARTGLPPEPVGDLGTGPELDRLLAIGQQPPAPRPGPVVVIDGPPGVDRSALLARAANRLAGLRSGPVAYLDLGAAPLTSDSACTRLLAALGADRLPDTPGARATLYRMLTSSGRGLLVLDGITAEEQARPLLPAGPGWLALLAGQAPLAGLDPTHRVPLRPRPDQLGARTVCSPGDRLDSPPGAGTWAGFLASYGRLGDRERLVLRRIARLPAGVVSVRATAIATGMDPRDVADRLESLTDRGLLHPAPRDDEYQLPDPLRSLIRALTGDRDESIDRREPLPLRAVVNEGRFVPLSVRPGPATRPPCSAGREVSANAR